jgi:cytochrome c553
MNRETQAALQTFRLWLVRTARGLAVGIMTGSHLMAAEATSARNDQLFEGQIRPLLLEKCVKCHGDD